MSFFNAKSPSVKLVGAHLVASFPAANPPLIWKFDLQRNHSFTIGLQGDVGDWELGLTSPKGEFFTIAHFPSKEDADEAMTKVQKVLMKKRRLLFWNILRVILGIVFLGLAVLAIKEYMAAKSVTSGTNRGASSSFLPPLGAPTMGTPNLAPAAGNIPAGVPLPADQVVQPPN